MTSNLHVDAGSDDRLRRAVAAKSVLFAELAEFKTKFGLIEQKWQDKVTQLKTNWLN